MTTSNRNLYCDVKKNILAELGKLSKEECKEVVKELLTTFFTDNIEFNSNTTQTKIPLEEMLRILGFNAKMKGYEYLKFAIKYYAEHRDQKCKISKDIYPEVSKNFNIATGSAEKVMRSAIENAWDTENTEMHEKYFGHISGNGKIRPTNFEFIAIMTDLVDISE